MGLLDSIRGGEVFDVGVEFGVVRPEGVQVDSLFMVGDESQDPVTGGCKVLPHGEVVILNSVAVAVLT